MKVSDFLVSKIKEHGVDTVFFVNGGGMMHLVDALARDRQIKNVHHHHEQCAGIAADAYARVNKNLGVCFATSGPGGSNLITAIVGAYQDSSPCLFIVGQSKSSETISNSGINPRQIGTFEVNLIPIVSSICKYAVTVSSANEIPEVLKKAIEKAKSGRPGPSVIEIPLNIQGGIISEFRDKLDKYKSQTIQSSTKNQEQIFLNSLTNDLKKSKKPCLLIGKGVTIANCNNEILQLAQRFSLPIVTTQFGKDCVDNDSLNFIGHCGPKGTRAGNFAIHHADLILSLGCSLHGQTIGWEENLFAQKAKFYRTDIDKQCLLNKKTFVDYSLQISVEDMLKLLKKTKVNVDASNWLYECQSFLEKNRIETEKFRRIKKSINAYDVMFALNESFDSDEIFIADAGSSFYVTGQALQLNHKQSFISSASLGAMGYALPAASGAAAAAPDRKIICITGDGSLMSNPSELSVAKYNNYNILYIILNNGGYVSMRNTQQAFFEGRRIGADISSGVMIPSLKKTAELYKINYLKINCLTDLTKFFSSNQLPCEPLLLDVKCNFEQEIIPTVKSQRLDDGTMISGHLHPMFPFDEK
tara:strand:+ start:2887 stop:4644 length:1758 start_codon:yes stop_codon:yes gene_type:complete